MRRNKTGKTSIETLENRRKAVELRRMGKSYNQISRIIGMSKGAVHKTVSKALQEIKDEIEADSTLLRTQELDRLDNLQFAYWADAMKGNTMAGAQILRIMERRAKILGIDQPAAADSPEGAKGGVMLVPTMVDAESWGEIAKISQQALKESVRE